MYRIPVLLTCFLLPVITSIAQSRNRKPPILIHPVSSVNPADSNMTDFAFLKEKLKHVTVVLLGEPTHGEGNVFLAKTKLVKYLHEQLGFDIIAFESGFYDVHKAQSEITSGQDYYTCLEKSIFPIWVNSRECAYLWKYLRDNKNTLQLAGFDPQVTGEYGRTTLREDLETWLTGHGITNNMPDLDLFGDVIMYMGDHFRFHHDIPFEDFEKQVNTLAGILKKIKYRDAADRQQGLFWIQCIKSCLALATDYHRNDPSSKTAETFKAKDSNPRDAQMADNLLFLMKQHPGKKIICWGATTHFMNNPANLDDAELKEFMSMGQLVKKQTGNQTYIIGATASSGEYGAVGRPVNKITEPPANSLEQQLAGSQVQYALIEFNAGSTEQLNCSAIEHKPLTGNWSTVLDAVLYVKEVTPSTYSSLTTNPSTPNPATDTGSLTEPGNPTTPKNNTTLIIKVTDNRLQPVAYASVQLSTGGNGTVANNAGLLKISFDAGENDSIAISSIGYKTFRQPVKRIAAADTVHITLEKSDNTLDPVIVTSPLRNPRKILETAINRIPTNYIQQNFSASVYMHEMLRNYADTLRDVEYILDMHCTGGYRSTARFVSALNEINWIKKIDSSDFQRLGAVLNTANTRYIKTYSRIDMLFDLPLFTQKSMKHYTLKLDSITTSGDENVYAISFSANVTRQRYTFSNYVKRFYGQLYINCADFAIVRYDMNWDYDTTEYNKSARRFFAKPVFPNDRLFWSFLQYEQAMKKTVLYAKEDGVYKPRYAAIGHRQKGLSQLSSKPVSYLGISELYLYDVRTGNTNTLININPTRFDLYLFNKPYNKAFWENFDRPYANVYSIN